MDNEFDYNSSEGAGCCGPAGRRGMFLKAAQQRESAGKAPGLVHTPCSGGQEPAEDSQGLGAQEKTP